MKAPKLLLIKTPTLANTSHIHTTDIILVSLDL